MCMGLPLGFLSCSIDLYFCFCASIDFTFSIGPYNKIVLCSILKQDFFSPPHSTILELEITISIIRTNESLSLKANIIKQIDRNLMMLKIWIPFRPLNQQ